MTDFCLVLLADRSISTSGFTLAVDSGRLAKADTCYIFSKSDSTLLSTHNLTLKPKYDHLWFVVIVQLFVQPCFLKASVCFLISGLAINLFFSVFLPYIHKMFVVCLILFILLLCLCLFLCLFLFLFPRLNFRSTVFSSCSSGPSASSPSLDRRPVSNQITFRRVRFGHFLFTDFEPYPRLNFLLLLLALIYSSTYRTVQIERPPDRW